MRHLPITIFSTKLTIFLKNYYSLLNETFSRHSHPNLIEQSDVDIVLTKITQSHLDISEKLIFKNLTDFFLDNFVMNKTEIR